MPEDSEVYSTWKSLSNSRRDAKCCIVSSLAAARLENTSKWSSTICCPRPRCRWPLSFVLVCAKIVV